MRRRRTHNKTNNIKYLLVFIIAFVLMNIATFYETTYSRQAVAIEETAEGIIFMDNYEHTWIVDTEEIALGQKAKLIIRTNCSEDIIDDDYVVWINLKDISVD